MNDTRLCPACGASNQCSLADPRSATQACWCYSVQIDPRVLEALPALFAQWSGLLSLHTREPGAETWPKDAWKTVGGANVWGEMSLDVKRGMNFLRGATELLSGALKGGPAVCADIGKLQ